MNSAQNKKGKIASIISVALCIAGIAAVTVVSVSRYNSYKNSVKKNEEIGITENNQSTESSQNEKADQKAEDVAQNISSEPYTQNETTQTKAEFVMPIDGDITKPFSNTTLQPSETFGDMRLHEGIDIKCDEGSPVRSASNGTVKEITEDANLGRVIIIEHGEGINVKYCGLKDILVKVGDKVEAGTQIATSGNPPFESAEEPHIHIETEIDKEVVSPLKALGLE